MTFIEQLDLADLQKTATFIYVYRYEEFGKFSFTN